MQYVMTTYFSNKSFLCILIIRNFFSLGKSSEIEHFVFNHYVEIVF